MNDSKRDRIESAMQMQAAMSVMQRAEEYNTPFIDVFKEFRRSKTFEKLFDYETALWQTGPVYILEEYDEELKHRQH